jgi:ankyrin repeat protein
MNSNFRSPLYIALRDGNIDFVRGFLVTLEADPNQNMWGELTPLQIAVEKGHLNIVEALLAHERVDPNLRNKDGLTPLHIAVFREHFEVAYALVQHPASIHHYLSTDNKNGYPELVNALLADDITKDWYLSKLVQSPVLMRDKLQENSQLCQVLVSNSRALWACLQEKYAFSAEYRGLLQVIHDSSLEPDKALRHPLYTLFAS